MLIVYITKEANSTRSAAMLQLQLVADQKRTLTIERLPSERRATLKHLQVLLTISCQNVC